MSGQKLPPKKDVAVALLERASVFVHLDPRKDDVRVPKWFKGQPQLVLQVGLNMAVPIPDLSLEDDALSCTLSFSRTPFFCFVPWSAVYALVGEDGRGMVWPDDVPKEVAAQGAGQKAPSKKPGLRVIEGDVDADETPPPTVRADPQSPRVPPAPVAELATRRSARRPPPPGPVVAGAEELGGGVGPAEPRLQVVEGAPAKKQRRRRSKRSDGAPDAKATNRKKKKRQLPPYLRVVK